MGFIKDQKRDSMGSEAAKAWEDGARVFTPLLNMPGTHHGMSGRVKDWELMVGAILEVGWELHTWAVCSDSKGRPQAQPLFVRPS